MTGTTTAGAAAHRTQGNRLLRRVDNWLLDAAPAERLGMFRVFVGAYGLVNTIISVGEFNRLSRRSASEFEPVGIAGLLDGPVSPAILWLLFALSVLSGAAFTAGAAFRVSGPVFAFCSLAWASYHASWGQMLHFEHLVTLHLLLLGFSPAADAWSVDARRASAPARPNTRYGWPLRLAATITAITYVLAGVAKIRRSGWTWIDGETLANHIGYSAVRMDLLGEPRPPLSVLVIQQDWSVRPLAISSLGVELLAPLALLGGWYRRSWVPAAILFHLGTLTTMFVFFSYNGLGFALLPLYRIENIVSFLPRPIRGLFDPPVAADVEPPDI